MRAPNPVAISAVPWLVAAAAAQAAAPEPEPWRLGVFFWHASPNDELALEGIREGLEAWGHPFDLTVRQASSDEERARAQLAELSEAGMDLVFVLGTQAALLSREHLAGVPVVFTAVTHPVESGVVPSWEGSGANLAGNSNWITPDTTLHVFRAAVPRLARLGVLRSRRSGVVSAAEIAGMRRHLAAPGAAAVTLVEEVLQDAEGIEAAVARLAEAGVQAIWIPIDFAVYEQTPRVLAAAARFGVPLVSSSLRGTRTGAVAGIHVDYALLGKRAAALAVRILAEGADPGALPVGTMRSYRVVVNLAAARRTGYEPPLTLLVRADVILETLQEDGE